ncbi:LPO_1073/Vpar_1526 family protein [Bacillus velezensis]|uniref:LPO_1073/Vpar_1526 family protein n=1 Tax=Bacillus velezensis TaxID=492670 RepID=UPI003E7FE065
MKKTCSQSGGDHSVNIQGETVHVTGLSYGDAKQICNDIFKENFYKLSQEANKIATERANTLIEGFLEQFSKNPNLPNRFSDPDLQYIIYVAQRDYARSGEKYLYQMLKELLVERTKEKDRSFKQVVLNEAIEVSSKLNTEHINLLSLHFLLSEVTFPCQTIGELNCLLNKYAVPFLPKKIPSLNQMMHLEYCKCENLTKGQNEHFSYLIHMAYGGLFQAGFEIEHYLKTFPYLDSNILKEMVTPLSDENNLYKFNVQGFFHLLDKFEILGSVFIQHQSKIIDFYKNHLKSENEISLAISRYESIRKVNEIWDRTTLPEFRMTSVGKVIAITNLNQNTDLDIKLEEALAK